MSGRKLLVANCQLLVLAGCAGISAEPPDLSGEAATTLALTVQGHAKSLPLPIPEGAHAREDCPTGGWVTHGDGHRTRCTDCRPEYVDGEMIDVEKVRAAVRQLSQQNADLRRQLAELQGRKVPPKEQRTRPAKLMPPDKTKPAAAGHWEWRRRGLFGLRRQRVWVQHTRPASSGPAVPCRRGLFGRR